ncbi:MAG: thioredoxin domain-containing protein [Chloroflexi bacterium]|nr:thioredoxin domain-containing protein [Chloroflexota bacterium]OJV89197.1 MAG: thioredoxin domain-containing protein [Chloroflexi bacterium 54-19]
MENQNHKHTNRLITQTSPYLLQHAHNPVDWYPWGEEALSRARAEDKPILLSIGYSACHWCHVMERESFENETIAAQMNENFVCIKVDREERPDLDSIYMDAVVGLTGRGGWPMTVFLTPAGVPFYGGTYYPPTGRGGMPGFTDILEALSTAYRERRDEVDQNAAQIKNYLEETTTLQAKGSGQPLSTQLLDLAWYYEGTNRQGKAVKGGLATQFDAQEGGLRGAPKFPQPMTLDFVLRTFYRTGDAAALQILELSLTKMAQGGIYDQLGGGFHRYSTDGRWLAPHFEKMLYDNSQLSLLYLHAYQATSQELYKRIAIETLDYVAREMFSPEGGFYSTQDADSEGEEGKFFVWGRAEIETALGQEDAAIFSRYYDVTKGGNWEGHNILHVVSTLAEIAAEIGVSEETVRESLARSRAKLFELREKRVYPGRDDKVLTSWNGLMLKSFALASRILVREDYREIALKNARFILDTMQTPEGRLLRTYKDGKAHLNGFLEDYSYFIDGLLGLYEATFDLKWLEEARKLADIMLEKFWDESDQTFFDTASDHEQLVTRPRSFYDNAVPGGNSVAADVLLRLALLTGDPDSRYTDKATGVLGRLGEIAAQNPSSFGRLLGALDFYLGAPFEVALVGNENEPGAQALLEVVYGNYLPNRVVMLLADGQDSAGWPLLEERPRQKGLPTAYVCQNYACQQPVVTPGELVEQLKLKQ